ncbi:hypothetical protein KY306_03195, partial [Candidatus Woesearchaeota archaeon]|nr:hypothetical protein [Candidatus Woesearchaeota archaeon]
DDAVYKSDGTLERKPVEGSVTTVNLPRFDNAMTLSIKNPLDLEEAIGFNIRDILLAKTEDFIIKGEFVSGNCGYGDEGDWCVVNYNVGEISEDILELEFPFEESWPFNKPPMSLPEERPRAEIGNFLEGKCDFNKIVPHKKLEPEEETAPEDGIEPGWGFLREDLEKFLPRGFDFENLFPKSPDAPEGVIFPCGRLIFVLTLNQESFDEGVDKLSKNDPEGLKFIPELQVIFKL